MSRSAEVSLDWADGHYTFKFGWGEFEILQEALDRGPFVVLDRLMRKTCSVQDISQTIRCGLIGGGVEPAKALKLVREYVESRPPAESRMLAAGVLGAALHGVPDETPGESSGEGQTEKGLTTSPTGNGDSI